MAYKGYFLDNATYGTDDFNNAFARLTTAGVSLFNEDMLISGTNSATASLVSAGTDIYNEDSCKVTVQDGAYRVLSGTCWLADGTFCVIDDGGVIIAPAEGAVNYVYIEHNTVNNTIDVVVSQTQGGEGSVPLAKINADGTVTDTRQLAYTKAAVSAGQSNIYTTRTYTDKSFIEGELFDTFTIKHGFKYVMAFNENGTCFGTACFESGDTEKQIRLQVSSHIRYLTIKKEGSVISLYEDSFGTNRPAKVVFA